MLEALCRLDSAQSSHRCMRRAAFQARAANIRSRTIVERDGNGEGRQKKAMVDRGQGISTIDGSMAAESSIGPVVRRAAH
jgi:hypothetical protein